jgi:two-component system sensor histidine kinase PilS (NtrC family)
MLVGMLSSLLYGGLVLAQYGGTFGMMSVSWVPVVGLPPLNVALYTMGLGVFGFIGVAGLSGYLAERARRADVSLERASTQIAGLQAFNQHVIESLTSGLATTDHQGHILTFNPSAEAITEHQAEDVLGDAIFDLLPFPTALEQTLRAQPGGRHLAEVSYRLPSGGLIDIAISAAPLNTPGGQRGLLFVFDDVTDARRLERESRLQQRLAAVGEMAAGIAHEIRNPLASMSGSIQILRQDLPLSDDQRKLMDIVLRESERLNETIRAFLAYARPRRFATTQLDLGAVINDACLLLRHSAEFGVRHGLEVTTPECSVQIEADENQIRQIIWNLATNALHAMPDGGCLRLSAATEPDGGALLAVIDEGVGMPETEVDGMFQPFHGSFRTGTGLGLAIVHRIVSDYGGEVSVHSREGVGTTVEVRFPAHGKPAPCPEPQVSTV